MDLNQKNIKAAHLVLMGTICGDIIGSAYEGHKTKQIDFTLFSSRSRVTDDTVCTIGIADALIKRFHFEDSVRHWCRKYPHAGYGKGFKSWFCSNNPHPYYSWGNGSAMRVSPIGAYSHSLEECLYLTKQSAEITHNHPEGIKGAQAVAASIFLALHDSDKNEIKDYIEKQFGYDLSRKYKDIQPSYRFDVSCQKSVPESIIAFLESTDYESAIRMAVSYGGDADTMAAIAGGIAAAYYGKIPRYILNKCYDIIPTDILSVIESFNSILE